MSPGRDLAGRALIVPTPVASGLGMVTKPFVCLCACRRPEELALLWDTFLPWKFFWPVPRIPRVLARRLAPGILFIETNLFCLHAALTFGPKGWVSPRDYLVSLSDSGSEWADGSRPVAGATFFD